MDYSKHLLNVVRNFALSFYLSGFFIFLVGWLWHFSDAVVFGIPLLFHLTAMLLSLREFRIPSIHSLPRLPVCILFVFLALNFLFSLMPPAEHIEYDALLYNLTIPWQHYLRGSMAALDWSMNDKFPMYLQMAQLPFTVICFPWVVKGMSFFALPALLVVCWNFAKTLGFQTKENAWIVAMVSSLALLVKQYGSANFDIINAVYILLGLLYLVRAVQSRFLSDAVLGAVFLGMGCAVKTFMIYSAFSWALAFVVWTKASKKSFTKLDILLIFLPFLSALIFMLPFLLRNMADTGNPFFPLFENIFGPLVTNKIHHEVMDHARHGYGYGHSLVDYFP